MHRKFHDFILSLSLLKKLKHIIFQKFVKILPRLELSVSVGSEYIYFFANKITWQIFVTFFNFFLPWENNIFRRSMNAFITEIFVILRAFQHYYFHFRTILITEFSKISFRFCFARELFGALKSKILLKLEIILTLRLTISSTNLTWYDSL